MDPFPKKKERHEGTSFKVATRLSGPSRLHLNIFCYVQNTELQNTTKRNKDHPVINTHKKNHKHIPGKRGSVSVSSKAFHVRIKIKSSCRLTLQPISQQLMTAGN